MEPKRNLLPAVFLLFFLVLGASLIMFLSQQPPGPLPVSIPASEFSAEDAFRHVEALIDEPYPVGTAAPLSPRENFCLFLHWLGKGVV